MSERAQQTAWIWLTTKAATMWWTPPRFTDDDGHKRVGGGYWRIHSLSFSYSGEQDVFDLGAVVLECWKERSPDGVLAEFHEAEAKKRSTGTLHP